MWKIKSFAFLGMIIGSFAEDIPPLSENACEITGFTVFHKKILQGNLLDRVYDPESEIYGYSPYSGRIVLDEYQQKQINIKTNVDSAPNCVLPGCVKTSFIPQFYRYASYSAVSNDVVPPYTLYRKPEKQYTGYLTLTGEAYHTSDCTGTPYSNMTQDVQNVLERSQTYSLRPTIVVYNGTSSPVWEILRVLDNRT
jgi:hypothetical protein